MTALARVDDVPDGGALLTHEGAIILTRRGARVSAFRNRCPHAGYPLQRADGGVLVQEVRYLVCAAHGASFDMETGACAGGPCNGAGLERVAISIEDGVISARDR
jgi:nitrite reductase/ring-hydroxylating ferredoxin subunit